jgi:hypothetical protein
MNRRSLLGLAAGAVVGSAGCVGNDDATPEPDTSPSSTSGSTSAESVESVEFELVDPEMDAEAAPEVEVDGSTVTARGTVQYGSSTCGTVELAHAGYESSQDRLDLLVVAADDPGAGAECTDDIDAACAAQVEYLRESAFIPDDVELTMTTAPVGEDDFTPALRELPDSPDMLVATGHPPGSIAIHNQAIELGMDPEVTTGAGFPPGVLNSGLGENAAEGFLHLHCSDPYGDAFLEVAERFTSAREERFDTHEAYGYVAGTLIAAAAEEAGEADPVAVADAIRAIELDTVFAEPLTYTEWGEIDGLVHMLSGFESGAPPYYPEGDWRLTETVRSSPIDGFDPDAYDFVES